MSGDPAPPGTSGPVPRSRPGARRAKAGRLIRAARDSDDAVVGLTLEADATSASKAVKMRAKLLPGRQQAPGDQATPGDASHRQAG